MVHAKATFIFLRDFNEKKKLYSILIKELIVPRRAYFPGGNVDRDKIVFFQEASLLCL